MSFQYTLDGVEITAEPGDTILSSATRAGVEIPTLCFSKKTAIYGACGVCVVEVEGVPKLLRACSAKPREGYVVHTDTERVVRARKVALELLLSDHTGDCRGPCKLHCPAMTDCQKYVKEIAEGDYKAAVSTIYNAFPLPASIGRVCPHPCEDACRRQLVEEPISIAFLKMFAADKVLADEPYQIPVEPDTGKKVAIVGGGPAGLTAAYFLRRYGHAVTIFDQMPKMGGMLRYGIPEYRLPKTVVDQEVKIIADAGVVMKNDVKLGKDIQFADLQNDYDAVLLAIGAWTSMPMRVPGEDLDGVIGGIDFLEKLGLGEKPLLGKNVAVCGGGNTAMDCCRTAVRLGAENVYVCYRRTRKEMPASDIEIDEAMEEGVQFKFLSTPNEFYGENGKLTGMKLQKMKLGEPDASGRRRPVPIEGDIEDIPIDNVLMAIGQGPDTAGIDGLQLHERKGTILVDEMTFRTNIDNVFAAGDITNKGAGIAIQAIAEAQKAAFCINNYLEGDEVRYKPPYFVTDEKTEADFEDRPKESRAKMPGLSPGERKDNFKPIYFGFTEEQAQKEARRCLECGCHDYYDCQLIKYSNWYDVHPEKYPGEVHKRPAVPVTNFISHNPDKCILCGLCYRTCSQVVGKTFIGLYHRGFATTINPMVPKEEAASFCRTCLKCVEVCPTGAMKSEIPVARKVEK